MTDIVERLREYASEFGLIGEAADEIEKLRAIVHLQGLELESLRAKTRTPTYKP